jgi:biotin synthase
MQSNNTANAQTDIRHDWQVSEIKALYAKPLNDLLFQAQTVHRQYFDPNQVQASTLMSIKTGACPEDCAYCPQSGHYNTGLSKEQLVAIDEVIKWQSAVVRRVFVWERLGAALAVKTFPSF